MIKNVLNDIGGVGLYGVVSICLFFTVFTGAMLWAFAHRAAFLATKRAHGVEARNADAGCAAQSRGGVNGVQVFDLA